MTDVTKTKKTLRVIPYNKALLRRRRTLIAQKEKSIKPKRKRGRPRKNPDQKQQ